MGAMIYKDGKFLADILQLSSVTPTTVAVQIVSTTVLNANSLRKYVRIANLSANYPVYLSLGAPAVGSSGIYLGVAPVSGQPGGAWTMLCKDFLYTGAILAISVGGIANVSVIEGI
jgi:hypothetical protein